MVHDHKKNLTEKYLPRTLVQYWAQHPEQTPVWGHWLHGSLMHCDVTGFTAMSETLGQAGNEGAELMAAILNRFFERMLQIANHWGGAQIKFGGDAMLLYFAGPDHAICAAACGLEMQTAMRDFRQVSVLNDTHVLRMRIGIHSGRFFSASVGQSDGLLHYLMVGADVNRTADVEPLAKPGHVVVSETTAGFLDARFKCLATEHAGIWRVRQAAPVDDVDLQDYDSQGAPVSVLLRYLLPPIVEGHIAGLSGEHRRATIVFIYLKGLSELLEQKGEHEALGQADAFVNILLAIVQKYGGYLAASDVSEHGDKLIVLFGAPLSLDRQESGAMRFACELQQQLADSGLDLKQQIGINSGFVFAGEIGSQRRREYTVIGDSVNLSARLMAAADSGGILVSALTAERTGDEFDLTSLQAIKVKGKSKAISIYRLDGVKKKSDEFAADSGQTDFVGRLVELQKLEELSSRAMQGNSALCFIHGEPGIGKTRLCTEIAARLHEQEWLNLLGTCPSYNSRIAYSAWNEPLRQLFGIGNRDRPQQAWEKIRTEVERLCPGLETFAPLVAEAMAITAPINPVIQSLDAKTRRERRTSAIIELLNAMARQQPVFLLFDDVHWIDGSSAELIAQLAEHSAGALFICLTSRNGNLPEGLMLSAPDYALQLRELSPDAARALVTQFSDISDESVNAIIERAKGNPLFLIELAQSGTASQGDLPESIYDVIMVRLDQLKNGDKATLQHASVIGNHFDLHSLRDLISNARGNPQ